jgi:hypothetical protein
MNLAYPCEDATLREQATVHLLPPDAIVLYHWLIGNPEGTLDCEAPICRVESYRGLLKRFTCATES